MNRWSLGFSLVWIAFSALAAAPDSSPSAAPGAAERQSAPQGRGPAAARGPASFAEFDLNGDGRISEQEFNEGRARRMAERARAGGRMRNAANAPAFTAIDANGDGGITPEEFAAHQSRRSGR